MKYIRWLVVYLIFTPFISAPFLYGMDTRYSDELQKVLDDAVISKNLKGGISAAVVFKNNSVWSGASGKSSLNEKLNPDMLLGMGSITKNFTATLLLLLAEEGKVSLSDPLSKWLPDYNNINNKIIIRQLLNHTSGIFNYTNYGGLFRICAQSPGKIFTGDEILKRFVNAPLFSPGTRYSYSNTNFVIAGMIIEKVTGKTVVSELRNRLFIPQKLTEIFLHPHEPYRGTKTHLWGSNPLNGSNETVDITAIMDTSLFSVAWTAGALLTTAKDLSRWWKVLFERSILKPASLKDMITPSQQSNSYGLGTRIYTVNNRNVYGHNGSIIYSADAFYSPKDSISISVLSNQSTGLSSISSQLFKIALDIPVSIKKGDIANASHSNQFKVIGHSFLPTNSILLTYALSIPATLSMNIYNSRGEKIKSYGARNQHTGMNQLTWNGKDYTGQQVEPGLYLFSFYIGNNVITHKIVLNE